MSDLNRVSYIGFDFDSHVDELRARTQVRFASVFNDFTQTSLGVLLLDHTAYALDTLSWYLDRRVTDLYTYTARTRRSVALLTRQSGYKMSAAIASSVDLQVGLAQTYIFAVPIPKGFQFEGPDDLIFETAEAVSYAPADPAKSIPAYEGETIVETFVSDGSANQVFELRRVPDDKSIANGMELSVDGAPWVESEMLTFDATDQFEVGYNNDPPTLEFGDAIAGNIPVTGATIEATYVATRGKAGQVSSGTIVAPVNALVVGFQTIELEVTNPEGSKGGDDLETLEQAKNYAPRVWKSRKVAVTQEDYESLAGAYTDPLAGRVAVARAISARSAALDLELQNLLADINLTVAAPVPIVDAAIAAITTALDTVDTALAALETTFVDIASKSTDIDTNADGSITSLRSAKNKTQQVEIDATDTKTEADAGKGVVDAIGPVGADRLSAATRDTLKGNFDTIKGFADSILTAAGDILTQATNAISSMGTIQDLAVDIGLTVATSGSLLESAEADRTTIETEVGVVGPPATGIREDVEAIDDAVTDVTSEVSDLTDDVYDHVDRFLAKDCSANLIVVPILTRDAGGFYAAPTVALMRSLKTYLDERKEVTQTVEVSSGEDYLVPAVVTVRVGVATGHSLNVVQTAVEAVTDGVLRERAFNQSLYVDEFYTAFESIAGIAFINVKIDGYLDGTTVRTDKLDAEGNLILGESEVITKGTVTVTPEAVTT
jgi:hypothetical protein